jgi:hypothetical protein
MKVDMEQRPWWLLDDGHYCLSTFHNPPWEGGPRWKKGYPRFLCSACNPAKDELQEKCQIAYLQGQIDANWKEALELENKAAKKLHGKFAELNKV